MFEPDNELPEDREEEAMTTFFDGVRRYVEVANALEEMRSHESERLEKIRDMIDQGATMADVRQAVEFTLFCVRSPLWDSEPINAEPAP